MLFLSLTVPFFCFFRVEVTVIRHQDSVAARPMNKPVSVSIYISIRVIWIVTMPRQENDIRIKGPM